MSKMAVTVKENMYIYQFPWFNQTAGDLFYPSVPTHKKHQENSNEEENDRETETRNERRKLDWENKCKQIKNRGPAIDSYT